MEYLFQIVSYIGARVTFILRSILEAAYNINVYIKVQEILLGGLSPSLLWATTQNSSFVIDFYRQRK